MTLLQRERYLNSDYLKRFIDCLDGGEHISDYADMNATVSFAKALADSTRLRIVTALRENELCVCELCDALEVTQSTLSTHLTLLRESGLVEVRREGKWMYYALARDLAPLTEQIFGYFDDMGRDPRVRRDATRVARRLKIREGGRCNRGFDQLDQTVTRKRAA
jgi:ArsR family transcriptional regulator, arsenate/arsenite/antimonite-responsive transcriptional repressor